MGIMGTMDRALDGEEFQEYRLEMVRRQIERRGIRNAAVLAALRTVPRHEFVPPGEINAAYEDGPLPIGYGQTISQPYVVALMTQLLELKGGERVLEIGTGSGYQAAVLAEIADTVYTVEIVEPLARRAAETFARLRYGNIVPRFGDGGYGWEELAPFDAILITAAPPEEIPAALFPQLAEGARMVAPVGKHHQYLQTYQRRGRRYQRTVGDAVRFVPLTGESVGS